MPDIPLKTFGKGSRSHTGYSKLQADENAADPGGSSREHSRDRNSDTTMPSASLAANSSFRNKKPSRGSAPRLNDYEDEEERLLSGHGREEDFDGRSEPRRRKEASLSVRSVRVPLAYHCYINTHSQQRSSDSKANSGIFSRSRTRDRSRNIPFRPPGICGTTTLFSRAHAQLSLSRQVSETISSKHRSQPEVQCLHIPTHCIVRAVQVFLQPLLPPGRPFPVRSAAEDWLV